SPPRPYPLSLHDALPICPNAFKPKPDGQGCWLDDILFGSREYAKRLGDRLKDRIFLTIFTEMAKGFLADRRQRLGTRKEPNDARSEEHTSELQSLRHLVC